MIGFVALPWLACLSLGLDVLNTETQCMNDVEDERELLVSMLQTKIRLDPSRNRSDYNLTVGPSSLPRSRLSTLDEGLLSTRPLFQKVEVSVKSLIPRAIDYDGMSTFCYHKTGSIFSRKLNSAISLHFPGNLTSRSPEGYEFLIDYESFPTTRHTAGVFWMAPFNVTNGQHHVEGVSADFPFSSRMNLVHWYRDPVSLILSAYRYHRGLTAFNIGEGWASMEAKCAWCDKKSFDFIFARCGYNCTYADLLNSLEEEAGVHIEAVHSSASIKHMVSNVERWANEPQVLTLSMEHLSKDFNQTMRCLFDFLGVHDAASLTNIVDSMQNLRVQHADPHNTDGKFDNSQLQLLLDEHPSLAEPLASVRLVVNKIYERQAQMYGCPALLS